MKNPIAVLNSIQLGKPQSLMVLNHDGFTLSGIVIHAGLSGLEIQAASSSSAIDTNTAIADILQQIKAQGINKPPKQAILLSNSAISAVIHLPVSPEKPRTPEQMRELVRWELEPLFAHQNERWQLGALLMGRGYLTSEQRSEIMSEVLSRNVAANNRMSVRFGEMAQKLDYATRAQVEECLSLQESLVQYDDDIECGWAPLRKPDNDDLDDEQPRFPWLATGMADGQRRTWVNACRKNDLFLGWIYPSLGAAFPLASKGLNRDVMLLDIQQEQFALLRGGREGLQTLRIESCRDGKPTSDQIIGLCTEELVPDLEHIILNAPRSLFETTAQPLANAAQKEVIPFSDEVLGDGYSQFGISTVQAAGLLTVADHALGRTRPDTHARIQAQPPKPPLWKRKEIYPYAAAAMVLFGLLINDLSMRYSKISNQHRLEQLETEFSQKMRIKKAAMDNTSKAQNLSSKVADIKKRLEETSKEYQALNRLVDRQQLIPGLLNSLQKSITDEVVIDQVSQKPQQENHFYISGWALSDTAAQLFVNNLGRDMKPWKIRVQDSRVQSKQVRMGLRGYKVEAWLQRNHGEKL